MSQLRLRQADGSFREILMIKGDTGAQGEPGKSSESINDNLTDNEHTWSSSKISTELSTKTNDADLVIDIMTANDTISSLLHKVQIGKTKKFQYTNTNGATDLPGDYPTIMINANCVYRPTFTINRITEGIMYIEVISANQSTGVPKILTGYYNGTFYWNNELSMTNVVNNLLTTTDGFVLDARQGKALKDNIDIINNNLTDALLGKIGKTTEAMSNTNANDFKVGIRFGYGDNITNHPYNSGFLINISHPGADAGIQIAFASNFGSAPSKPLQRSYLGNTYSGWYDFLGILIA